MGELTDLGTGFLFGTPMFIFRERKSVLRDCSAGAGGGGGGGDEGGDGCRSASCGSFSGGSCVSDLPDS